MAIMTVSLKEKINDEIGKFQKGKLYVFIFDSKNYSKQSTEILKYLVNDLKLRGIYIALNKTKDEFEIQFNNQLDNSKLFKILRQTGFEVKKENFYFIENQDSLVELSLQISSKLSSGFYDFIFFDSFSDLSIYHELIVIKKFFYYLANNLKVHSLSGIIVSSDNDNSLKILNEIQAFSEKIILLK